MVENVGAVTSIADRLGYGLAARAVALGDAGPAIQDAADLASPWSPDPLGELTFENLFHSIAPFVHVSRQRALKISTVAKAQQYIAMIGRMPLRARMVADGTLAPLQPSLLRQPERGRPRSLTLTWTADALLFHPATWWIVRERDFYQWPTFVEWVPQHEAQLDSDGRLVRAFGQRVDARDIIEFTAPDGGLLSHANESLKRMIILQRAVARAEANPVPSIDLHNDGDALDDDQIDKLIDRWTQARAEGKGVGYTSKAITAKVLGQAAEQLLIDGRKQLDLEITRHTGFPAWALDVEVNAGGSLTYSNPASRWRDLLNVGMDPIMTAIADRLGMPDVTPGTQYVEFDTDRFTRDDMKTRFEAYKVGIDGGFITTDQIKQWEGWA
ncbi:hypothetical protein GCM10022287_30420 [Gryllotalpicola koreensis]|uniref:Phage portal protein n=1 Tax=Gryllotalpicola koreensis TaxID=993086 RepID=A0ABP8A6K6_9MICO